MRDTLSIVSKAIPWLLKCIGFCVLGIILLGIVGQTITPIISWAIYHNDPTSPLRRFFGVHNYFLLCALYGFTLGLIPLHRIRELLRSYFGKLTAKSSPKIDNESDWKRPILWAWLPVGLLFLLRFILWQPLDHSVLATAASQGHLEYFFSSPASANMNLWAYREGAYLLDRVVLTGPTIFLLAYPLGVWLRHQFPSPAENDQTVI